jgi:hypothetical protein
MSVSDIKTDYSSADAAQLTTLLNADHTEIKNALLGANSGGGFGVTGAGRIVGADESIGRAAIVADDLFIKLPDATYRFDSGDVALEGVGGFTLIAVPASMAAGKYAYLTPDGEGSVEVLPANWRDTLASDLPGAANLGFIKSDAEKVTAIDYSATDEIQTNAQLLKEIASLQKQIDNIEVGEGGGSIGRGDLIDWDAESEISIKEKTLALVSDAIAEMKDYVYNGPARVMQMPNDRYVEAMVRTRAALIRLSPEAADLVEEALMVVGFAGHAADGSAPPALGVNGTDNHLLYTTLQVNTPERELVP